MSLSNPNKSVTEERLAEFYQSILPYLGGMPEAVCNKFDKANLYSTDEKVIGCWTDGRPVYQKTYIINPSEMPQVTTDGTLVNSNYNLGLGTSINVIYYKCSRKPSSSINTRMVPTMSDDFSKVGLNVYITSTGILQISSVLTVNNNVALYFTIQYTKTTDAANSFKWGDENDYSTDEKIVGTWIDGSYVYQKTINFGALPNNTRKSVAHGISNYKQTISFQGFAYNRSKLYDSWAIPEGGATTSAVNEMDIWTDQSNIIIATRDNWTDYDAYVTLKYLKTT